jgi:hypothetical protein
MSYVASLLSPAKKPGYMLQSLQRRTSTNVDDMLRRSLETFQAHASFEEGAGTSQGMLRCWKNPPT